jgi:hypothetical protein
VPPVPEARIARFALCIARSAFLRAILAPVPPVPEARIARFALRIARSASPVRRVFLDLTRLVLFIAISASVEIDANCP